MRVSKALVGLVGLAGVGVAVGAPGEDPIKDGQTVVSRSAAASGGDPIKDGQTFMAISGNDLGAAAPNRANWSTSAGWSAYVYEKRGIQFVQINDEYGVLRIVVALSGTQAIVLPMGVDADGVTIGALSNQDLVIFRSEHLTIGATGNAWHVQAN